MHKVPPSLRLYNQSVKAAEETETSPRGLGVADQPRCLEDDVDMSSCRQVIQPVPGFQSSYAVTHALAACLLL